MKKKILSICLVIALAVTAIGGATLAYFTDDEQAKNVFEVGGVEIQIIEKKYENNQWVTLEDDDNDGYVELDRLHPGVVDEFNKVVYTRNVGEDAAYIRTFVAVENTGDGNGPVAIQADFNPYTTEYDWGIYHGTAFPTKLNNAITAADGRIFDVYVCEVNDRVAVEPNDYVYSLAQVNLTEAFTSDDAEDLQNLEVYVVSEAIQEAGLSYEEAMAALQGDDASLEVHAYNLFADIIPETNK